ncbi:unnamed protein product [Haemonchus placei]|uniref:UBA domain-containing protein n=1 Tax=Haemonchus placei TaxID=6290 RepID=A0A3P7VSJ8_HAEPC|nr:unnamed protein product [Haemonchus placei]
MHYAIDGNEGFSSKLSFASIVIETTRCTQARAELALYDNDNDLAAAIDYILEHGSEIESWTEQKSKKDKKKEEEEKRPARGQPSTRGRGSFPNSSTAVHFSLPYIGSWLVTFVCSKYFTIPRLGAVADVDRFTAGVEFVTATIPPGLSDYHFGFVDGPQNTEINASAASVANANSDDERQLNGDFSLKASPPISHSYGQQQQHNTRSLSYADPSSVSYAPTTQPDRGVGSGNKPPAQIHHPPQQSAAHQAPQQMFPTQMPYGSYPYMNMNMYSPVTGVRAEDQYAALYAASMPFGMGVDLSAILPPTTPMSQAGANQQHPGSTQHRSDTHNLVDMNKFASGNTRDGSGQQPSNVAPPPGFANPSFMPQPGLSSLFLQQQFPPHPYSFMMPNVGSGRQMYPQEDDRKSYDKMGGAKQAQATPPQHYHNGGYLNSGLNKKPYNWNS